MKDVIVLCPETVAAIVSEAGPALVRVQQEFSDGRGVNAVMPLVVKIDGVERRLCVTVTIEGAAR